MKISQKLLLRSVLLSIIPLVLVSLILGRQAASISYEALGDSAKNQLIAIRDLKKDSIEQYFGTIRNQILTFSNDRMVMNAMREFDMYYSSFINESSMESTEALRSKLSSYYTTQFDPEYKLFNVGKSADPSRLLKGLSSEAVALQYAYIQSNPNPLGGKDALDMSLDGSSYSASHGKFHPHFRDYLNRFGYYDIFLVSNEGNIVYSVFKELDYATSLISGPYANSGIAEAFRGAASANSPEHVTLTDFKPYTPSYEAPASFIASPIYSDNGTKLGVLIFQMPIDRINGIMTQNQKWEESGLGKSGETYIVGSDLVMRSMSRFLFEDKAGYLQLMRDVGVSSSIIELIAAKETSIGLQPVDTEGSRAATGGAKEFKIFNDYRGIPVLSAYAPLEIPGLDWVIMSEIDEAEAFERAEALKGSIATSALLVTLVVGFLAVVIDIFIARTITSPIRRTVKMLEEISHGDGDITVRLEESGKDELTELSRYFNKFVEKIHDIMKRLDVSTSTLSSTSQTLTEVSERTNVGISNQKQQTESLELAMQQMSSAVQEVSENAHGAEQSAREAEKEAQSGNEVVFSTIDSIGRLAEDVEKASQVIHKLNTESANIGAVLDVIKGIAEQTNLLALNAAIEAARAGEQGRGFAVVADEVRTLASRTQESTQEIQSTIERLQQGASEAVFVMDKSRKNLEDSVNHAEKAGESLNSIIKAVGAITEVNAMIATATEQQSAVSIEINQNITNINAISDENAEAAQSTSVTGSELKHLSDELQSLVRQFKI